MAFFLLLGFLRQSLAPIEISDFGLDLIQGFAFCRLDSSHNSKVDYCCVAESKPFNWLLINREIKYMGRKN